MSLAYRAGSYTTSGDASNNSSGGNLTLNKPTGVANGDIVAVGVYFEPDTTTITVSNGPWESVIIANTGAFKLQVFFKEANNEPASYTISNSDPGNQWRSAWSAAYSGGTGSGTRIDVSGASQADGQLDSGQTAPSITPNGDNRMIVFGYGNFGGTDPTGTAGFCTNFRGSIGGCALGDAFQTTAAATGTTNETGAGTQDYAAMHVALISDIAVAGMFPPWPLTIRPLIQL